MEQGKTVIAALGIPALKFLHKKSHRLIDGNELRRFRCSYGVGADAFQTIACLPAKSLEQTLEKPGWHRVTEARYRGIKKACDDISAYGARH